MRGNVVELIALMLALKYSFEKKPKKYISFWVSKEKS